jgi:hypothetical protein
MTTPLIHVSKGWLEQTFGLHYTVYPYGVYEALGPASHSSHFFSDLDAAIDNWREIQAEKIYRNKYMSPRSSVITGNWRDGTVNLEDAPESVQRQVWAEANQLDPKVSLFDNTVLVADLIPDGTTVYRVVLPTHKSPRMEVKQLPAKVRLYQTPQPGQTLASGVACSISYTVGNLYITPSTGNFDEAHELVFRTRAAAEQYARDWASTLMQTMGQFTT